MTCKNTLKTIFTIFIFLIGQLTYGQKNGKYISNPKASSTTILILKKNHTFKFKAKGQVANTIRQSGKWKVKKDTLILYNVKQPIYRIGLFEMPTKWIVSKNSICGIPNRMTDYHDCLKLLWQMK